jgi:molecular chaperone GrpE
MYASVKDFLRAGGRVTREVIVQLIREHDALEEKVRTLRRREAELEDRLEAQGLEREALQRRARDRDEEIERLRRELEAASQPGDGDDSDDQGRESAEVVARLERRIESLLSDLNRLRARAEEAASEARRDKQNRLLAGLGQLLDSLDRAIEMSDGPWKDGLLAMESQFVRFLEEEGVETIEGVGQVMDPHIHNAVAQVDEPSFDTGQIVEVRRKGFRLKDGTVVRPAEVVVAR